MGCTLLMWLVATANFRTADRVLNRPTPEAAPVLLSLPDAARRPVLRHLASELNRWLFRLWGALQMVLGAAVLALLLRQSAAQPGQPHSRRGAVVVGRCNAGRRYSSHHQPGTHHGFCAAQPASTADGRL